MTPTQLRAYSAVVRHGSVKDAAAEIGVTEAAVSLHLRQLDIPEERERIYQSHAVLGRDPASWRPSPRLKLWLVTAGVPIYLTIAGAMYAEGRFIMPTHSLADIHRGAIAMLIGGVVLSLAGDVVLIRGNRQRRAAVEQRNVERRLALVARS